ncbi:MAG: LacI family DNA-binding transcriptional regulator [Caldilineales bacterium]|nr:LacI family DNA-binding transcriptional regulator [Caldilineales bacterium]
MSQSPTIRDVAKRAGVGVGTVSRVLNNHPSVSISTREMVEEAIAELDFSPNPSARRLSSGKTMTIAVVAPFFTRPAFVERLRGVVSAIADSAYDVVVYDVETPGRREQYFRDLARRDRADGLLIIALPPTDEDVARFTNANIPVVLLDCSHPDLHRIVIDDVYGGFIATKHLLDLGHRLIGYLSDSPESPFGFVASRYRLQGYRDALADAEIDFNSDYHVVAIDHGIREARQAAKGLLQLPVRPTAVFASSDTQAIGVIQAANELGLRVPDELSVIGYDDIDLAEFLHLSTVHQPLFTSGAEAVDLLMEAIANPSLPTRHIQMPLQLAVRQSTAPLAQN